VGGAEQILSTLDRALAAAGHRSLVIAAEGSETADTLIGIPRPEPPLDKDAVRVTHARVRACIAQTLTGHKVDLVHMHGFDFADYLPPPGMPVLATLHLPTPWYSERALRPSRPDTWLNCVSNTQHATCVDSPSLLPPIPNGVHIDDAPLPAHKREFVLSLGRICPEKGNHIALDAAKRAQMPLILAGQVFPYPEHQRYFEEMIKPRLDGARQFIGPVGLQRKRELLASAHCLAVTSLVAETSSLVSLEALAAGTPVIAFGKGALPEVLDHGRTGFLVWDEHGLAAAMHEVSRIDPAACRLAARERFSAQRMIDKYFATYTRLVRGGEAAAGLLQFARCANA
jgi:glycosyltransferase involved in cell wall biosynthesis